MEKYKDIIQKIKKPKLVETPDNSIARVMQSIDKLEANLPFRFYRFLFQSRKFTLDPIRALRTGTSYEEISLYFMLVAFAHLTFTVVLLMGLKGIDMITLLPPLLRWQPWFSLSLACWLVFWGFILKKNTRVGVNAVRIAALFYMEAVLINGTLLFMEFNRIFFLLPVIAAIAGSAIAAGIFLAFISSKGNNKDHQESICSY